MRRLYRHIGVVSVRRPILIHIGSCVFSFNRLSLVDVLGLLILVKDGRVDYLYHKLGDACVHYVLVGQKLACRVILRQGQHNLIEACADLGDIVDFARITSADDFSRGVVKLCFVGIERHVKSLVIAVGADKSYFQIALCDVAEVKACELSSLIDKSVYGSQRNSKSAFNHALQYIVVKLRTFRDCDDVSCAVSRLRQEFIRSCIAVRLLDVKRKTFFKSLNHSLLRIRQHRKSNAVYLSLVVNGDIDSFLFNHTACALNLIDQQLGVVGAEYFDNKRNFARIYVGIFY